MTAASTMSPAVMLTVVAILLIAAVAVGDRGYWLIVGAAAVLAVYVYGATT